MNNNNPKVSPMTPDQSEAVERASPPISPLRTDGQTPAWQRIDMLFQRHGLEPPPYRLRDELVNHLAWAEFGVALLSEQQVESGRLREALERILFLRPGGPTRNKLVMEMEDIARDALEALSPSPAQAEGGR